MRARHIAAAVGAPLAPGTQDPVRDAGEVLAFAREYGFPVAMKAAFGGGGRGLKVAWRAEDVVELYESAVREATAAFGRGSASSSGTWTGRGTSRRSASPTRPATW